VLIAAVCLSLAVVGTLFWKQRRQLRALQRVIDHSGASLNAMTVDGSRSSSSVDLCVLNGAGTDLASTGPRVDQALEDTASLYAAVHAQSQSEPQA